MTRKTKRVALIFTIFILAVTISGCASVVSKELLRGVDRTLGPATVQTASAGEDYKGRRIVWGGLILGLEHKKSSTVVEVFSTPLDSSYRPTGTTLENSVGARFLIESPGFLDEVIYSKGSGITVVGVVQGIRKKKIGEMDYPYPVISPVEVRIFDMTVRDMTLRGYPEPYQLPYTWGPLYSPYGGYYGGPYYWPPHRYYYPYP